MPRILSGALAIAVTLLLVTAAAPAPVDQDAAPVPKKKHRVTRHWHGYGFLPGYRPPEVIERERAERAWQRGPHYYGPAWPGFYRGRWNGGGFGPCYTQTPIGYMWNCGR